MRLRSTTFGPSRNGAATRSAPGRSASRLIAPPAAPLTLLGPLLTVLAAAFTLLAPLPAYLAAPPLHAQQPTSTGRLVGRVLDTQSGRPLTGAQVVVEGTALGVLTGLEGRYIIVNVPAGRVAVRAGMVGYAEKTVTGVVVEPGRAAQVDIALDPSAVEIEGLTVSAERERGSVATVLNEQRAAVGVVNAIGAEQIGRSPDGNAADAVRRVSGVTLQDGRYVFVRGLGERYTTSALNGARIPSPEPERKVVPLDLFPAGLIQTISTRKTFTPDQPGDFSGGSVDIRTREFPARRQATLSLSTGYHPDITGRPVLAAPREGGEWLARAASPRAIPAEALDLGTEARRGTDANRIINSFRNRWSVLREEGGLPASGSLSVGGSDLLLGRQLGYLGSLTYSRGVEAAFEQRRARALAGDVETDRFDGETGRASVLLGGLLNLSAWLGSNTRVSFDNGYNRSAENEARMEEGVDENTASRIRIERLRYVERTVRSSQLRVEHQLAARHRLDASFTTSGVSRSEPDRSEFITWLDPNTPVWFNDFEGAVRSFGSIEEHAVEGAADYTASIGAGTRTHRLRTGLRYRETERDAASLGYRIQAYDWAPDDPRWQQPPEVFFDGRYSGDDDAVFLLARELSGGSYAAADRMAAAYAMAEVALGARLTLVGGARVERYRLDVASENNLGQALQTEQAYTDVLPALALNLEPTARQKLRFSAARTLARPEYRELAPITYREVLGGEQVIGNADLRRTLIDNVDIRWEFYPSPAEAVSVGLFAKRFDGPIEQRYLGRSGTDTRSFENAERASNLGVELEAVHNLGALAPRLEPLSVFSNVTVMRSRVLTGDPEDHTRAMVGQAPWVVNAGITYLSPSHAFSGTLLFNAVGARIVNARPAGRNVPDVIERPRPALDLSLRFPVFGGASGKLDLRNLLDSPHEVVQGDVIREYHRAGRSVSFGLTRRI